MQCPRPVYCIAAILFLGSALLPTTSTAQDPIDACMNECDAAYAGCLVSCIDDEQWKHCYDLCTGMAVHCWLGCLDFPEPQPELYIVRTSDDYLYYDEDLSLVASFVRHDSEDIIVGPGTVSDVELYVTPLESYDTALSIEENTFEFAGNAEYNANSNSWVSSFNLQEIGKSGPNSSYLIRAVFYDPSLPSGKISGLAAAIPYPDQAIPTLSEWGLIIFCALLFGWMAWMIVRRRKTAEVGI